ncbi:ATP-binding protein [Streptomyces sp. URMC 123]|uniref:ATP-binding protein n=1 Tax=Streptomyces sp. URMC 123 TaxID=3423403 RepID=UPI003F1E03A6
MTTAALTYREARNAILKRTQDSAVRDLRSQINSLAPDLSAEPTPQDLREFGRQLSRSGEAHSWSIHVSYRNGATYPDGPELVTPELRATVGERKVTAFQRVSARGEPWLVIGMPVMYGGPHSRAPSGLDVYAELPLHDEKTNVEALVNAAQRGALPAVGLAVVPALLAARGVLRPVRELRRAARKIAGGELHTRLKVSGGDELADLSRTFNEMAATLDEKIAELDDKVEELRRMEANARRFAADVSHELRTPLAAMSAVTDVLDEDAAGLDPDTAQAVRLVSQETGKLVRMVEDLMEVSRFDAGAAALHLDEVDVAEVLRKTLQIRGWHDERVVTDLPEGVRTRLDPRRLDVVVANLVGNALRHGGAPVLLRLREGERHGERLLWIDVADSGPGIDPEVLPHVFERFYKADAARARSEGSGLGLAIALENVRLHGGTLRAANSLEGGAVFTVELPRVPAEERT